MTSLPGSDFSARGAPIAYHFVCKVFENMAIILIGFVCVIIGAATYLIGLIFGFKTPIHPPLPPGPKGLPLIGNITDLPPPGEVEARHWLKHKQLYGACFFAFPVLIPTRAQAF